MGMLINKNRKKNTFIPFNFQAICDVPLNFQFLQCPPPPCQNTIGVAMSPFCAKNGKNTPNKKFRKKEKVIFLNFFLLLFFVCCFSVLIFNFVFLFLKKIKKFYFF
jgi:hypothetical protein